MPSGSDSVRVVIADDHEIARSGVRLALANDACFAVVGEAGDVAGALRQVRELRPELLLLDLNMPGGSSLQALPALRRASPTTRIVILTMEQDPAFAQAALAAGAVGYLLKQTSSSEIVRAAKTVADGQTYLQPSLGAALLTAAPALEDDPLTPREREVVRLIALGHTNPEIAEQLRLGKRTVETYRARAQAKLGLSSRAELVRYARRAGLDRETG